MNQDILSVLKQSYDHLLQNNTGLKTSDLEAEIINLACYIYLKDDNEIDFSLDYLDQEILYSFESYDFETVDHIIDGAKFLFSKYYNDSHAISAKQGVRMNIQLAENFGSFLKSYFISRHKISDGEVYEYFSSPRNSLWQDNIKQTDSPTQRDINYKFSFENNTFEILINPYNPLVTGEILTRTSEKIICKSYDSTRRFEFLYANSQLYEVVMHRIDKGDVVIYHQ